MKKLKYSLGQVVEYKALNPDKHGVDRIVSAKQTLTSSGIVNQYILAELGYWVGEAEIVNTYSVNPPEKHEDAALAVIGDKLI